MNVLSQQPSGQSRYHYKWSAYWNNGNGTATHNKKNANYVINTRRRRRRRRQRLRRFTNFRV